MSETNRVTSRVRGMRGKEHHDTIVIGGGQAGLAAGYYLREAARDFVLLEATDAVGSAWRSRWDSLRLFTPGRYDALPGMRFPGEPYALPRKDDVAQYLSDYATRFELPIRFGARVSELTRLNDRFIVDLGSELLSARAVIVATGGNQRPRVPELSSQISPAIRQMHSSQYHRPSDLPDGDVLVVGAGNSGAQIAMELAETRKVFLSGPDTGSMPRNILGRDLYDWLWPTLMRPPVDSWIGRRLFARRFASGDPLIGISRRDLDMPTLTRVGRTTAVTDGRPRVDDGAVLDVNAIVWCTGYEPDFSWIRLPVFGPNGYPNQRRGLVDRAPGLGFLGLRYQTRMGSALLGGVGEDASHVVRMTGHDASGRG